MSGKYNILLVDDSPVIQTLLKKILFGLGMEVTGKKVGAGVVDLVKSGKYDVVILDIILPDADGYEIAKEIRNIKKSEISEIPIIAISGNYKNYNLEDFKNLDIQDYLVKPLDYDKLVNAVQEKLGIG